MTGLQRAIDRGFMDQLTSAARSPGWWRDVLDDRDLIVAFRGASLDVYWRGQSLFHVEPRRDGLHVTTHEKFLFNPDLKHRVTLFPDGIFDLRKLSERGFIRCYDEDALGRMKRAASIYAGLEKAGCHEIAVRNANVIDVEIAFPGTIRIGEKEKRTPRVDMATVSEADDGDVRLSFWEAKHFSNGELVSRSEAVPVLNQIEGYRGYIEVHRDEIEACYRGVAKNIADLEEVMGAAGISGGRKVSPLFRQVAQGRRLTLGPTPQVGLIIFGYDDAQWTAFADHFAKLGKVKVKRGGKPGIIRL